MVTKLTIDCQYSSNSSRLKLRNEPSWRHNLSRQGSQECGNTVAFSKLLIDIYGFRGVLSRQTFFTSFLTFNSNIELTRRRLRDITYSLSRKKARENLGLSLSLSLSHTHTHTHRVYQEKRSLFWEVTVLFILSKRFIWTCVLLRTVPEIELFECRVAKLLIKMRY